MANDFTFSDGRYLQDAKALGPVLDRVAELEVKEHALENGCRSYSVLGAGVKKNFPHAQYSDGVGMEYVNHMALVPVLVLAIQELKAELDSLKAKRGGKRKSETVTEAAVADAKDHDGDEA